MTKRTVYWTPRAKADYWEIALFIAQDNPEAADRWMAKVDERVRLVAELPYANRKIPEWRRDDLREVILGNYRIMYRVGDDDIQVLRIVEGHRRYPGAGDRPA